MTLETVCRLPEKIECNYPIIFVDASIFGFDLPELDEYSCTHENLQHLLYEGVQSLDALSHQHFRRLHEQLGSLRSFVLTTKPSIIPEVFQEVKTGHDLLNTQAAYFRRTLKYISDEEDTHRFEMIKALDVLCKDTYKFLHLLNENRFSLPQDELFSALKNTAIRYSSDLVLKSCRSKSRNSRHPQFLGEELETDQKIVATAVWSAYNQNTLAITNDSGIMTLSSRVISGLSRSRVLDSCGNAIHPPHNNIAFYNPRANLRYNYNFKPQV
jgi:hypothetical protein